MTNVCIPAGARRQQEKLCRHAARPPVSAKRVSRLPDGRPAYRLKGPRRDAGGRFSAPDCDKRSRLLPRGRALKYSNVFSLDADDEILCVLVPLW